MTVMSTWARSRTALSMAAVLALVACGGGGGGSSSSSSGSTSTVAVSGVASKGVLLNAVVTAYAANADGSRGAKLASTTTSATDGSYNLTGLPPGVVVLLEVTPQAGTKMVDEATNTTVDVPTSSGFALRAAVNLDSTGTTSAQITPFTDMAVKLAEGNGGLKADVVTAANGSVSAFAGISILSDKPTFTTTTGGNVVATNAAAAKLAAISELVKSGGATTGCSTDPVIGASCVLAKLQDSTTSSAVAAALNTALTTVLNDDAVIADPLELAKAGDTVSTPPSTVTVVAGAQTAIQEAKALIASVRATAAALSNQADATSLAARLKAVADTSRGVAQPLDDGTMTAIGGIAEALAQRSWVVSNNLKLEGVQLSGLQWMSYQPYTINQVASGCKFYTDNTFTTLAYSGGVLSTTDHMGCRILQHVVWAQDAKTGYWSPSYAVFHRVLLSKVSATQFTVRSVLKKSNIVVTSGQYDPITNPYPYTTYSYDALANETALSSQVVATVTGSATGVSLTGEFAPGVEPTWTYNATTGYYDQGVRALGTKQAVSVLTSDTTVDASTTRRNFSGDVAVYDGAAVQSRLSVKSGSYVQMKSVALSALNGSTLVEDGAHLVVEGQVKSGYKIGGTLDLSNFTQTATRWGPNNGAFSGYVTDVNGVKLFDGALTLVMPTDSGLGWDVKMDGTLVTTGTNTLAINLTAKQSATVSGDLTVTGRYTQGTTTFLLTLLRSELTPANNQLSFSTAAGGVGFVYKPNDALVPIKKGDAVLGQFNVSTSRLVYADGTYEQF